MHFQDDSVMKNFGISMVRETKNENVQNDAIDKNNV